MVTTKHYDGMGRLWAQTNPDGSSQAIEFDCFGHAKLERQVDEAVPRADGKRLLRFPLPLQRDA